MEGTTAAPAAARAHKGTEQATETRRQHATK